ncbi:MAG: DinB family protein [Chitinophagales bacterium]|nr:DinB family protein [Chitinophagales bacterium]MDW8418956.1 DinB family protein [Chitinophagales bacterium]
MNLQKLEADTHRAIDYWISELSQYDMEQILRKPSPDAWSMGQVAIHLWMSAKNFFFANAEKCLAGTDVQTGKGKTLSGHIVFTLRMMPPVRFKMPAKVAVEPRPPDSMEQLMQKLNEIKTLATEYIYKIPQSNPAFKVKHPFLGYLNAAEWITLCNIHFRHHVRQKKRIEHELGLKKRAG